jgi:hypothetical protein
MMRSIRIVTPDGHVWFVRRRWARRQGRLGRYLDRRRAWRRAVWLARGKAQDLELAGPTSKTWKSMARSPLPQFWLSPSEAWMWDIRSAQNLVVALIVTGTVLALAGLGFLGWLMVPAVRHQIPSHPTATLTGLAGVLAVVGLVLVRRPWLVEAERQGLDPPRRVWRVIGWRRSGRCIREVAAAIAQGRLDVEPAGAAPENPRSPLER